MTTPKKILIADDDSSLRQLLKIRLEGEGYEVVACQDAYQALETARARQPDLIILDINMPAGNGFSVQERIAKIEALRRTPVIYITGDSSHQVDQEAHKAGAYALLRKPFSSVRLLELVRTALGYWSCDDMQARSA